jgi:hypothetical protein
MWRVRSHSRIPGRVGALEVRSVPAIHASACLLIALISSLGFPGHPPTRPSDLLPAGATRVALILPLESESCATTNSNASLEVTYSSIYDGLPDFVRNWTASPNATAPVNQSGYPNLTVGESQLVAAWTSICESYSYTMLFSEWGSQNTTSGSELNDSTGVFQAIFGFTWHGTCTNASLTIYGPCEFFANWLVDLATGETAGPLFTETGGPSPGGPPGAGSHTPQLVDFSPTIILLISAVVIGGLVFTAVSYSRRFRDKESTGLPLRGSEAQTRGEHSLNSQSPNGDDSNLGAGLGPEPVQTSFSRPRQETPTPPRQEDDPLHDIF